MGIIKDYLIILRIRAGDIDAWEKLIEKYYDQIYHYCKKRFFGNDRLAEELMQEIFLKIIGSINTYKFTGSFFNFLFTVTVNTCNNYGKKRKFDEFEFDEAFFSNENGKRNDHIIVEEMKDNIQKALNQLPSYQKEVLILKYYYDMKVKDIALITKTSIPTVQSRINQGLKKMKKIYNKEDFYFEK